MGLPPCWRNPFFFFFFFFNGMAAACQSRSQKPGWPRVELWHKLPIGPIAYTGHRRADSINRRKSHRAVAQEDKEKQLSPPYPFYASPNTRHDKPTTELFWWGNPPWKEHRATFEIANHLIPALLQARWYACMEYQLHISICGRLSGIRVWVYDKSSWLNYCRWTSIYAILSWEGGEISIWDPNHNQGHEVWLDLN